MDVTFTDGQDNTLILTRVALVVREIELKRQFSPDCDDAGPGSDDCEKFSTGPMLFELPLDGQVRQVVEILVPPDTYDELSFDIHKPSDDTPEDIAFIQQNPTFADISILVEGTFNGGENEGLVENNIKKSIDAFRDDDRNGRR